MRVAQFFNALSAEAIPKGNDPGDPGISLKDMLRWPTEDRLSVLRLR
jgi:hypothetical protein